MSDPFALDRKALVAVALLGLVLGPAVILLAVWKLTHGLDFVRMTTFEWIAGALSLLLVGVIVRAIVRELSGAIGLRFDEQGVARGRTRIAWSAITEIGSPEFGRLILRDDSGRTLRIATYLFHDRALMLSEIGRHCGVETRERTLSI